MKYIDEYINSLYLGETFNPSLAIMRVKGVNSATLIRCNDLCNNDTSLNKSDLNMCLIECQIKNIIDNINGLRREKGGCSENKNPPKCLERIDKLINKMQERLNKKKDRLQKMSVKRWREQ